MARVLRQRVVPKSRYQKQNEQCLELKLCRIECPAKHRNCSNQSVTRFIENGCPKVYKVGDAGAKGQGFFNKCTELKRGRVIIAQLLVADKKNEVSSYGFKQCNNN